MERLVEQSVTATYDGYPPEVAGSLLQLRDLIIGVANELRLSDQLEETLKWGEPAFVVKGGSTVRVGWKKSSPDEYAMYFNCNSKLMDTFREVYGDAFVYQGNRALIFGVNEKLPKNALKECIKLALIYHKVKHLPLLGAKPE